LAHTTREAKIRKLHIFSIDSSEAGDPAGRLERAAVP